MFRERDVSRLVKTHGKSLTLTHTTTSGTYNTTTGLVEGANSPEIIFRGYLYHQKVGVGNTTQLVGNDLRCLIPKSSLTSVVPTDEDSIEGKEITKVRPIESNGQTICYLCELKG